MSELKDHRMKDFIDSVVERREIIRPWMDKLGAMTANDIAEFLKGEGIKAKRNLSHLCAIAEFLKKETGLPVRVTDDVSDAQTGVPFMALPETVSEFVEKFDSGDYPDLVKGRTKKPDDYTHLINWDVSA